METSHSHPSRVVNPVLGAVTRPGACMACRIAKVKCSGGSRETPCERCTGAAIRCIFPLSRRGRAKGSKNLKTLQRLAREGLIDATFPTTGPVRTCNVTGISTSVKQVQASGSSISSLASPSSPLDPFLAVHQPPIAGPSRQADRAGTFNRTVLNHLEKDFPTDLDRSLDTNIDPETGTQPKSPLQDREFHNPLLFLAECARKGWDSDTRPPTNCYSIPLPLGHLPPEDSALLQAWSAGEVQTVINDQRTFFQHGLHGSKRDVAGGLDAVQRGVVREGEVQALFDSYFCHVHPQWTVLDVNLHTPAYVRSRSAFLFTVVLALGATSLASLPSATPHQTAQAVKLHAHAEKLQLVICATAAKSVEIIQAELLYQMWALRTPRIVDDQRSSRLGMCYQMAHQVGLQYPSRHDRSRSDIDKLARNDLRLRLSLILVESRWESLADRKPVTTEAFDLSQAEAERLAQTPALCADAIIAAEYALYRFEVDSKRRLDALDSTAKSTRTLGYDAERVWIATFLNDWSHRWCDPQVDSLVKWYFRYASMRSRLVGLLRIAKAQSYSSGWSKETRKELLAISVAILEGGLSHERALHMLRPTSTFVFASTIIFQLAEADSSARDLCLRVALRLAGDPRNSQVMTYMKHNGYQILNMLCLSNQSSRTHPAKNVFHVADTMPNEGWRPIPPLASNEATQIDGGGGAGAGSWAEFEQLFDFQGSFDFPYIPDQGQQFETALPHSHSHTHPVSVLGSFGAVPGWQSFSNGDQNAASQSQSQMPISMDWLGFTAEEAHEQGQGQETTQADHNQEQSQPGAQAPAADFCMTDLFSHLASALGG